MVFPCQEIARMETDFAKVSGDASGLAADMVRVRSERAEAGGGPDAGDQSIPKMVDLWWFNGICWEKWWFHGI